MVDFSTAIGSMASDLSANLATNAVPILGIVGIVGVALFVFSLVRKTVRGR